MNSRYPNVSVVMSVFNAEKYLSIAIESILSQTYVDFEFIIIDDGSTDGSLKIAQRYEQQDERVVLISRENLGLIASLNEGIDRSKGGYIARMDADDISMPDRLERQVKFIEENNLDVCGSATQGFNECKNLDIRLYPESDNDIKFTLMLRSPFAHPAVMIKKSALQGLKYRSNYQYAEDYMLWVELALARCRMGNIDKVLLKYRIHKDQITAVHNTHVQETANQISQYYLKNIDTSSEVFWNYVLEFQRSPSRELFKRVLMELSNYQTKFSASGLAYVTLARIVLRRGQSIDFWKFLIYRRFTKGMKKKFRDEFYLLIQSLFGLSRNSRYYRFFRDIVKGI